MEYKHKKTIAALLTAALGFIIFAAMPLIARAADGPFQIVMNPIGATYSLNETAAPLKATFAYDALVGLGYIDSDSPITVQWFWSYNNSNTERTNGLTGSAVAYSRQIAHTTTLTPATDAVGVKYYYAVLSYAESVTDNSGQWAAAPKEAVTDPARIEVIAPAAPEPTRAPDYSFRVKKTDENGNPLSGATLALVPDSNYAQDPSVKSYEQTTVNGFTTFTALPGYYILREKYPPEGYAASNEQYYILVAENGVFMDYNISPNYIKPYDPVTFVNKGITATNEPEHDFRVRKTDENGNLLSGAILTLIPDGNYAQSASAKSQEAATSDGYVTFSAAPGYYILSEKQAPKGYNATDVKYYIHVTDTGVFMGYNTKNPQPYQMVTFTDNTIPLLNKEDHFAYMVGYPEGTFGPSKNMTRSEAVVMFSRLLSKSINMSVDYRNNYYRSLKCSKVGWPISH